MAHLFKHTSTRWVDANGKRVKSGTPGATKHNQESNYYWAKYRDATGKLKKECLKVRDESVARRMLIKIEDRVERERAGLVDSHLEQIKRPLSEHVDEWVASFDERITEKRRIEMPQRVRKLVCMAGWKKLTDITEKSTVEALNKLRGSDKATNKRLAGAQTWNHYLAHIKQFVRWCVPERLEVNPIAKIKRHNVEMDVRHERRQLSEDEQRRLLECTAKSCRVLFELDGPSRALLYKLALATGFRRGELQSLTQDSFDLERRTVTLAAKSSKHRKVDVQPLPAWIIEPLRTWFAEGKPLWPNLTRRSSEMIRADMETAGIPYRIEGVNGPLFADFHALRHTFVTNVARTDMSVADMMRVTRHSSAELFLRRYAKTTEKRKAECVNQLPDPMTGATLDLLAE